MKDRTYQVVQITKILTLPSDNSKVSADNNLSWESTVRGRFAGFPFETSLSQNPENERLIPIQREHGQVFHKHPGLPAAQI